MFRPSLVLIVAYVALLLPALQDFRIVMGDEASYADPALRWCDGLGFTSAAWWQSPDQFWACNFPAHAVTTAAWVKLTGCSSLWCLRALSLFLYAAGLVLWILGCRRAGWFKSSFQEIGFLGLLLGSLYATAPSQYVRPEALGSVVLGLALWGQTCSSTRSRLLLAFLTGALAALTGLQFAVALAVFGLVWWLIVHPRPWAPLLCCLAGGLTAIIALVAVYGHFGVLDVFLRSTFGLGSNRAEQWHGWRDPMLWACSAVLLYVAIKRGVRPNERRWAAAGLAAGPGLAFVLYSLSKYPQYYGFLAVLPACTAVAAVFSVLRGSARAIAVSLLVFASAVGFPLSAVMNWNLMPTRRHTAVEDWCRQMLGNSPAVFADPSAYFASRNRGRIVYSQAVLAALSPAELSSIRSVVIVPDHPHAGLRREAVLERLGGEWRRADVFPDRLPASRIPALDFLKKFSYAGAYRFEAWERVAAR